MRKKSQFIYFLFKGSIIKPQHKQGHVLFKFGRILFFKTFRDWIDYKLLGNEFHSVLGQIIVMMMVIPIFWANILAVMGEQVAMSHLL